MAQEVTPKVIWTEPAICDLEKIDRDLRRRNPAAADRIGEALLKKAGLLSRFPELGPVWEEDPAWRYLVLRPYKIFTAFSKNGASWRFPTSGRVTATPRHPTT